MVTLSFTIFSGQKNYNRAHMLFQVLCGFEPIFYTTHPNEESNDIVILQPKEIYMVRVENKDTIIYGKEHRYRSRKRLYEMQQQLGAGFMQISKSTLVNLSYMSNVEAGFSGTLLLKLKNGCKDYVSRKYLPEFKKYLGL